MVVIKKVCLIIKFFFYFFFFCTIAYEKDLRHRELVSFIIEFISCSDRKEDPGVLLKKKKPECYLVN